MTWMARSPTRLSPQNLHDLQWNDTLLKGELTGVRAVRQHLPLIRVHRTFMTFNQNILFWRVNSPEYELDGKISHSSESTELSWPSIKRYSFSTDGDRKLRSGPSSDVEAFSRIGKRAWTPPIPLITFCEETQQMTNKMTYLWKQLAFLRLLVINTWAYDLLSEYTQPNK
jgi:hypothetical protein